MAKLLSMLHYFIIGYALFLGYETYMVYDENRTSAEVETPRLQAQIAKRKRTLKQLKNYYKDIEIAKARIERVAKEVEKLQRQLPNVISDTSNLHKFSTLSKEINIKNVYLSPEREDVKGFYVTKEYSLKASGTYLQFLIFLEKIGEDNQLYNIKSVQLDSLKKKQKGRFQLINGDIRILAYRYNEAYKEDRGFDKIETDFKNKKKIKRKSKTNKGKK